MPITPNLYKPFMTSFTGFTLRHRLCGRHNSLLHLRPIPMLTGGLHMLRPSCTMISRRNLWMSKFHLLQSTFTWTRLRIPSMAWRSFYLPLISHLLFRIPGLRGMNFIFWRWRTLPVRLKLFRATLRRLPRPLPHKFVRLPKTRQRLFDFFSHLNTRCILEPPRTWSTGCRLMVLITCHSKLFWFLFCMLTLSLHSTLPC